MIDTIFKIVIGSMDRPIPQVECGELRTQLYIASEIGLISKQKSKEFIAITQEISAMLYSLIKTRQEKF